MSERSITLSSFEFSFSLFSTLKTLREEKKISEIIASLCNNRQVHKRENQSKDDYWK